MAYIIRFSSLDRNKRINTTVYGYSCIKYQTLDDHHFISPLIKRDV